MGPGDKSLLAADARWASECNMEPVTGSFSLGKGRLVLKSKTYTANLIIQLFSDELLEIMTDWCETLLILIYGVKTSLKREVTQYNFHVFIIRQKRAVVVTLS